MARKRSSKKSSVALKSADSPSVIEMITRFWVTLFVILVILYAATLMISRTDGFKGLVRQRIEAFVKIPLAIDRIRVSPSLNLVIEGLHEAAETNQVSRINIERAEVYWKFIPLIRGSGWPFRVLKLDGCSLRFVQDKKENWSPLPQFNRALMPWVGGMNAPDDFQDEAGLAITEYLRQVRAKIEISNLQLEWLKNISGEIPMAQVLGISFESEAVKPLSETILWCRLQVEQAISNGNMWLDQLDLEWIRLHDQDVALRVNANMLNPNP